VFWQHGLVAALACFVLDLCHLDAEEVSGVWKSGGFVGSGLIQRAK
jgi:hypothetical protein